MGDRGGFDSSAGVELPAERGGAVVVLGLSVNDGGTLVGFSVSALATPNELVLAGILFDANGGIEGSDDSSDAPSVNAAGSLSVSTESVSPAWVWVSADFRLVTVCMTASDPRQRNNPTAAKRPIIDRVIGIRRGDSDSDIAVPDC
jgi:hypothetical protein